MSRRVMNFERLDPRELLAAVQLSTDLSDQDGSRITVPVQIDDATGVRAAEIRMKYDPAVLAVESWDVKAGSVWTCGGSAMAKVDEDAGEISIFVFATEPLQGQSGSLVDIEFSRLDEATTPAIQVDLSAVRLNEGEIESGVFPTAAETKPANPIAAVEESDYINPRVREKNQLGLQEREPSRLPGPNRLVTAAAPIATAPAVVSIIPQANEGLGNWSPRLSRERNQPIGPFPLTVDLQESRTESVRSQSPAEVTRPVRTLHSADFWLMAELQHRPAKRVA